MSRHALLKTSRLIHLYFGVFITPALIFFAFTGAVQTFDLHETNRDHPNYVPARILVILGQIHKKQTPIVNEHKPQPPASKAAPPAAPDFPDADKHERHKVAGADATAGSTKPTPTPPAGPTPAKHNLPLRIFFLVVSTGLLTSTATGLYMSYKFVRNKTLITITLIAGIIIPILLTLL